ncbi:MAG TPA: tetratricopeptide repeat protein [Rhodocyclaceae bacterium]|nr:tetratricopeptide repeat protein [Rhodocyclaceae bacterium]
MAVYDHEEQEQLEALKAWWRDHGNKVVNLALAAAVVAASVSGWKWWQDKQAVEASSVYGQLQAAAEKHDAKVTRDMAVALAENYSGTVYAGMGALLTAKIQAEAGDLKNAKAQLTWAADKASDPSLRDLARLRLAGLLLDEKAYDEALQQLGHEPEAGFAARYAELKGDIYAAQGKGDEARTAYQAALNTLDGKGDQGSPDAQRQAMYRELMQLKLDSVGGKA